MADSYPHSAISPRYSLLSFSCHFDLEQAFFAGKSVNEADLQRGTGFACQFEYAQVSLKLIPVTAIELRPLFRTCKLLLIINYPYRALSHV